MRQLEDKSVDCCVTSPPYFGLRDYKMKGQFGLEDTPEEFVASLVVVFREVRRVLRDDGTVWLNLGDSYANDTYGQGGASKKQSSNRGTEHTLSEEERYRGIPDGLKKKDIIGIPWRVAFALQADGWYLRQDIIWHKPNPMPESVKDRCTKAHEYLFLLSKGPKYYFDSDVMQEKAVGGASGNVKRKPATERGCPNEGTASGIPWAGSDTRNRRSVWTVATKPFKGAHFAVFPPDLIEPCVLAGCPKGGTVLDPFTGSGTTGMVAVKNGRDFVGCELNPEYAAMARERINGETLKGFEV